jgi:tRNA uridine 5-carboxymethylaminomethyl modification enzyme
MKKLERRKSIISDLKKMSATFRNKKYSLYHLLKMPEISFEKIEQLYGAELLKNKSLADISYIEATVKYEGYIKIQKNYIQKMKNLKKVTIPPDIDYYGIDGLSTEVRQKLSDSQPANLEEALKVPGITPASVNAIQVYLTLRSKSHNKQKTV